MSEPLLRLCDVSRRFDAVVAVDGVTLDVRPDEVLGLIGPNGAGKTTLVNLVSGYFEPTGGTIEFAGESMVRLRPHQLARRGVARTYQNLRLFEQTSVLDNVLIGRHLAFARKPWRLGRGRTDERAQRAAAQALLERLGIGHLGAVDVSELSYGLRRRVEIARALATEPRLLLLDEPTAGMTRTESADIGELVLQLKNEGITVVLVDHNVRLVSDVCDRIAVLDWGRLLAVDTPATVWADQRVRDAYLGVDAVTPATANREDGA